MTMTLFFHDRNRDPESVCCLDGNICMCMNLMRSNRDPLGSSQRGDMLFSNIVHTSRYVYIYSCLLDHMNAAYRPTWRYKCLNIYISLCLVYFQMAMVGSYKRILFTGFQNLHIINHGFPSDSLFGLFITLGSWVQKSKSSSGDGFLSLFWFLMMSCGFSVSEK